MTKPVLIELAEGIFMDDLRNIKRAHVNGAGNLEMYLWDKQILLITDKEKVQAAVQRLREVSDSIYPQINKEENQMPPETVYDNDFDCYNTLGDDENDFEEVEPEGIKIQITKTSSIDAWVWTVEVNGKEFKQVPDSYNWGNKVKPASHFIVSILSEITGVKVKDRCSSSSYALGKNQIPFDYIEGTSYDSDFWTPAELKEYIIKTVAAIRAKVTDTNTIESVTFRV
jgi:hypothetical protein